MEGNTVWLDGHVNWYSFLGYFIYIERRLGFNDRYILGIKISGLPLEEYLFFFLNWLFVVCLCMKQ